MAASISSQLFGEQAETRSPVLTIAAATMTVDAIRAALLMMVIKLLSQLMLSVAPDARTGDDGGLKHTLA